MLLSPGDNTARYTPSEENTEDRRSTFITSACRVIPHKLFFSSQYTGSFARIHDHISWGFALYNSGSNRSTIRRSFFVFMGAHFPICDQGRPRFTSGSDGRRNTRSPRIFRYTSPVPPPIVSAFENMYPLYQLFDVIDLPAIESSGPINMA